MAVWPATLQDKLNADSFQFSFGETSIRTEMDIGPAKVRRRFTAPIDQVRCSIDMTSDQYEDLYYFFNTTLNGGVNTFTFNHPVTQTSTTWRFTAPPSVSYLGGGNYRAEMSWEVIP